MKIVCIKTHLSGLDYKDILNSHGAPVSYSQTNAGSFKVGMEFIVMGICLYRSTHCLFYLLDRYESNPDWNPYSMFKIVDNSFPSDWCVKVFDRNERETVHAIWGFSELCNDNFDQKLVFRESTSIHTYFQRKQEVIIELYPEMLQDYNPDNKLILIDQADNYVMCEHCTYAWGIASDKKNIACPKCSQIYKNPFLPSHRGMDITKSL